MGSWKLNVRILSIVLFVLMNIELEDRLEIWAIDEVIM